MISIRTYAAANTAHLVVTGDNFPVIAGQSVLLLQHCRLAHVRSEDSKTLLVLKSIEPVWLSIPDSYLLSRGRDLFE